jgi:hypothetical protein
MLHMYLYPPPKAKQTTTSTAIPSSNHPPIIKPHPCTIPKAQKRPTSQSQVLIKPTWDSVLICPRHNKLLATDMRTLHRSRVGEKKLIRIQHITFHLQKALRCEIMCSMHT